MRLANAANYFEDTLLRDPYTNAGLFRGSVQIDSSTGGSSLARRHALCLPHGVTVPTRRAVKFHNEVWVIGDPVRDMMFGIPIKVNYMAVKGTDLMTIKTPGQAALGTTVGPVSAWAQNSYLKSTVNNLTDSQYDSQYECFFAHTEAVNKGSFLIGPDGRSYYVRNTHVTVENFRVAEIDQLDQATPLALVFETGAYDPIADTFSAANVNTTGMLVDMYKLYKYDTQSDPINKPGDYTLVVAQSAITPQAGKSVIFSSRTWRIHAVDANGDGWNCHVRMA